MELLLIRHGEAAVTGSHGRINYNDASRLTELGRRQGVLLGQRLAQQGVDHLYASPMRRAMETAEILAAALNMEVRFDDRFREIDVGKAPTGRGVPTFAGKPGPLVLDFAANDGEGSGEFGHRVAAAIDELIFKPHGASTDRVALVAHGGFINAVFCAVQDVPFTGYVRFGLGNTSISIVRDTGAVRIITSVNDCLHLLPIAEAAAASGPGG